MDCSLPGSSVQGTFQAAILDGLIFSSPGDLPNAGIKLESPASPALAGGFFTAESSGKTMTMTFLPNLFTILGHFSLQSSRIVPGSQVAGTLGEFHSASPVPSSRI